MTPNAPPIPKERVLPTLNEDGSRRRIRPKLYQGKIYRNRLIVGWGLIVLFVVLPFIQLGGKPLVLLDVANRQFHLFGRTFLATDGVLLMLLMLSIFIFIILVTALVGRAWCGWGCPQTVYMELLFRPIERLIEGDRNAQLKRDAEGGGLRRAVKNVIFFILSVCVANVFLAYFVGPKTLAQWMGSSPAQHPAGFLVMAVTAGLVFFDFAYFREQMCTVICPYARLQSALLDKDSLIIGYQAARGEPRHLGKSRPGDGDCVDCSACVVACPTGIDIRDGLQLECIACGQCVDACNTIMPKVKKDPDLIRYASQRSFAGGDSRAIRPRVVIYSVLLAAFMGALVLVGAGRADADITVLRGIGAPFIVNDEGEVQNQIRVKLEDRAETGGEYELSVLLAGEPAPRPLDEAGARAIIPENPLAIGKMERRTTSLFVVTPKEAFRSGKLPIVIRVLAPDGSHKDLPYTLLGPQ